MLYIDQQNLGVIRTLLTTIGLGDWEHARDLFTEDVRFHFPGNNSLAGTYEGLDKAMGLLEKVNEWTGKSTRVQLHDILANDHHGILMYTVRASHGDRSITYRYIDIYHFREGRISEVWGQPVGDVYEFDAFYSE